MIARHRLLGLVGMYGLGACGRAHPERCEPHLFDFWSWAMERFEGAAGGFTAMDFKDLLEALQRDD